LLPNQEWVKIKTKYAGICGSDINMIFLHDSPSLEPFNSFPATLGHENVGIIVEKGSKVKGFKVGDIVIVDPTLPCSARGIEEVCSMCKEGNYSLCLNVDKGNISKGIQNFCCGDVGGGFAPHFVAHQFQLFKVPDTVSDENAVLVDPLASALHAVLRNFPNDSDTVPDIGAAIMGLCTILALRVLGSKSRIINLAKYDFQAKLAKEYGADKVVLFKKGYYEEIAKELDGTLLKPILGKKVMIGGADVVFECVGNDNSVDDALRFTRPQGKMVLIGLAGVTRKVDWSFVWFKELQVVGTNSSARDTYKGKPVRDYQLALDLLAEKKINLSQFLTHKFKLSEYKKAIKTTIRKRKTRNIKTVFYF
jgi:threonine dehydrogenase-like Zn-dependent dehydrogenase